ncbi:hypothetical protein ACE1N8_00575 [Streptomyces sp. DSM 116494]
MDEHEALLVAVEHFALLPGQHLAGQWAGSPHVCGLYFTHPHVMTIT